MKKVPLAVPESDSASKRRVSIGQEDLQSAATDGLITNKQADELWKRLLATSASKPGFDLANLAWYSGAVIVMIAMGWFLTEVWDLFSGGAVLATAAVYSAFFYLVGGHLWKRGDLKVPGGLLVTLGVAMTPLAVFGLERVLGMWDGSLSYTHDLSNRLIMEGATIVAGLVALRLVRFPFITAPLSLAIWLFGMEGISYLAGHDLGWEQWRQITLVFGLAMTAGAYFIDRRTKEDYAFWGYLVGVTAFWWSLTLMDTGSEIGKLIYALINAGLMVFSVLVGRRVFVFYGAMGVIWYLGYLAFSVFSDSMLFPIALSFLGLGVIYLGIKYHRNRERIETFVLGLIPESLRGWLPQSRG